MAAVKLNISNINNCIDVWNEINSEEKSPFLNALANLSGIYTVFSIGSDVARRNRLVKRRETLQNCGLTQFDLPLAKQQMKAEGRLNNKVRYLVSGIFAAIGVRIGSPILVGVGVSGALLFGAESLLKGGFDDSEELKKECVQVFINTVAGKISS